MGRKAREPKIEVIDLLAEKEARKKAISKTEAQEKKREEVRARKERIANKAKAENRKIMDEQYAEIYPHFITMNGKKELVIDPVGAWSMATPPYIRSPNFGVHIAHSNVNPSPDLMFTYDTETWQLRAGVMGQAGFFQFSDDDVLHTRDDFESVVLRSDIDDTLAFIDSVMGALIARNKLGIATSKIAKVYAHNGTNFDYVASALRLGIDRNYGAMREVRFKDTITDDITYDQTDGNNRACKDLLKDMKKLTKVRVEIHTFAKKSKIIFKCGRGGEYKVQLIDSVDILPTRLKDLGDDLVEKGNTPLQYTEPLEWFKTQKNKDGEFFKIDEKDLRLYLLNAHKHPLAYFSDKLKPETFEALTHWKNYIEYPDYIKSDVVVLANALKRFARKFRKVASGLIPVFGHEIADVIDPFSYNTASTAGFALSVAYWYASMYQRKDGKLEMKRYIKPHYQNTRYAYIEGNHARILHTRADVEEKLSEGAILQYHGVVKRGQKTVIVNPITTTEKDNRFSRIAQNGSQTSIIKPICHGMREFDLNSSFPNAEANGCLKTVQFDGYSYISDDVKKVVSGESNPVLCNALIGFEEPGSRQSSPTRPLVKHGIATSEMIKNEHGELVKMWVVRGRNRILRLLQIRNGEFTVVLPPTKSEILNKLPIIPFRTPGKGLDSRLVNARIVRPTMLILRGEYIAAYAAQPTVDDEAMVIYLCEESINEVGQSFISRERSRHGAILGVSIAKDGHIFGAPHMPHKEMVSILFNLRLEEKEKHKQAKKEGNERAAKQYKAESEITKLILNAGGYGMYAQNTRPEIDFQLTSVEECRGVIEKISGLDPSWTGMHNALKEMKIGYTEIDDTLCSWKILYDGLSKCEKRLKEAEDDTALKDFVAAMRRLFLDWADHQITTFTTYTHKTIGETTEPRGILVAAEETAPYAIRCYASAVVAKAAVNLYMGQEAVERSPFSLAYFDTDSLLMETYNVDKIKDKAIENLVKSTYEKRFGFVPEDTRGALEQLMRSKQHETFSDIEAQNNAEIDDLLVRILEMCGLKVGKELGAWGLENTFYNPHFVPQSKKKRNTETDEVLDNEYQDDIPYISHRTYFLGTKIYFDLDENDNLGRAKVRSIPKLDPLQPAVLVGAVIKTPSLADRRGLVGENFRKVRLDTPQSVYINKDSIKVEALFSNPRRKFLTNCSSEPFDLDIGSFTERFINNGYTISAREMSRSVLSKFGLDIKKRHIKGLQDAYTEYKMRVKIADQPFSNVQKSVVDKIDAQAFDLKLKPLMKDDEDAGFIGIRDEDDNASYVKQVADQNKNSNE